MNADATGPATGTPRHVAIIMDGNGRWAEGRGLPRVAGHEAGADSVVAAVRACRKFGVKVLTLYAFSVENWSRPKAEIRGLMTLLQRFLKQEEHTLHEERIRLRIIGEPGDLPALVRRQVSRVMAATRGYDAGTLCIALSYGGRRELVRAAQQLAAEAAAGRLQPEKIDEAMLAAHLYAPDLPDPDLMIRTSGERRISNFLLWQLSYAELVFTDVLWPDFREEHFEQALHEYAKRKRRFGGVTSC